MPERLNFESSLEVELVLQSLSVAVGCARSPRKRRSRLLAESSGCKAIFYGVVQTRRCTSRLRSVDISAGSGLVYLRQGHYLNTNSLAIFSARSAAFPVPQALMHQNASSVSDLITTAVNLTLGVIEEGRKTDSSRLVHSVKVSPADF